jgi:hypothetical protein
MCQTIMGLVMGRAWTTEDAARRLLFLFIGRQPSERVHISQLSKQFVGTLGTCEELISAVVYASQHKWLAFDGELVELLPVGFAQPHEFPGTGPQTEPSAN